MASRVKKSQTLYPFFSFMFFILAFVFSIFAYLYQYVYFYLGIIFCISIGIVFYVIHVYRIKKYLSMLIQTTSDIIDGESYQTKIIDGESQIAVLSSHLAILDTRMRGMVERLSQEQDHLKDYIEDISHQIKTPLTSMILREEMLLEITHNQQEKEILLHIYHQTEKIKDLIESLLHLAQIESHSIEYHKQEYDLEEIIEHISESLLPLKEKHDVTIQLHHIDHKIYCDEKWMSEALENILKNCIEQKDHSTIDITCEHHHSYLTIYIQDHGEGFQKEDIPHIFERFYQGQSRKGHGVGIGLSMSKGIIDGHFGNIEVMNHQGALFKITLPHKNTKSKFTVTK